MHSSLSFIHLIKQFMSVQVHFHLAYFLKAPQSSSLAVTGSCWMHILSSEQSNIQDGPGARRVLQSVPAIWPPLETNDSDKLSSFLYQSQTEGFLHHYSVLLLISCGEPRVVWKTYCAGLWWVGKDKIRVNHKGQRHWRTHWISLPSVHAAQWNIKRPCLIQRSYQESALCSWQIHYISIVRT